MADSNGRLAITDARHGRNGVDPPQALPELQCAEASNIDFYNAPLGRKRGGVASVTLTNTPFTGQTISSMFRHVPGTDETAAELWATDDASTPHVGRLAAGTAWSTPTLKDAPTGNGWDFSYASVQGKLFIAYKSAVDRLHVWDGSTVRRTGLAPMSAAYTITDNGGAGTYAAVNRHYQIRFVEVVGGVVVRRSEYAPTTYTGGNTPDGAHLNFLVTILDAYRPKEGETHFELHGSTDPYPPTTFYRIATVAMAAIGTDTTYADTSDPSTYSSFPLSDPVGTYVLQKSYRYIAADQGRLLGFGAYTTTNAQNRVEWSSIYGDLDVGDLERCPIGNFQGLDESDSGPPTGLGGPVGGSFFAFKTRQSWKLTPTGVTTSPYALLAISKVVGAVSSQSITVGEDEVGNPALCWMSQRGPYRWGASGVEYIGKAVEDKTIGASGGSTINLAATKMVAHSRWYPDKRQMWFWLATGSSNDPDTILVMNVGRQATAYSGYQEGSTPDGWSIYTGGVATARCSALLSTTLGATMSRDLKPYIGSSAATDTFGKCDTGTQDLSANYRGLLTTRAYHPWGEGFTGAIMGAQLIAPPSSGVTITVGSVRDYGIETRTDTCLLTAAGSETRVMKRLGGAVALAGCEFVQFTIGDSAAANTSWQIDSLVVTWKRESAVVA